MWYLCCGLCVRVKAYECALREHLFDRVELADRDARDVITVFARQLAVNVRVVLAVVAHKNPTDVRKRDDEIT